MGSEGSGLRPKGGGRVGHASSMFLKTSTLAIVFPIMNKCADRLLWSYPASKSRGSCIVIIVIVHTIMSVLNVHSQWR